MKYNMNRREQILSFLMTNRDGSFTAEQVAAALLDGGGGKSSVYRILAELTDGGCVRRITDGASRRVAYQYVGDEHCHHHLHLKCKGCGRLFHLDESTSREVAERLSVGGFIIDEGELLFGRCDACGGTNDKLSS